jgi:hypothetical protein
MVQEDSLETSQTVPYAIHWPFRAMLDKMNAHFIYFLPVRCSLFNGRHSLSEYSEARSLFASKLRFRLTLTALGLIGLVLGFVSQIIGSVGFNVLIAGALLWSTAFFGRKNAQWSSQVRHFGDILIVFGGMASIGSVLSFL